MTSCTSAGARARAGEKSRLRSIIPRRPRRGLYFIGPDAGYPDKPLEAWTQGEDEDSRYWFPCYDYPNDRVTSEVIATVPETFTAVSNGELIGTRRMAPSKRAHFIGATTSAFVVPDEPRGGRVLEIETRRQHAGQLLRHARARGRCAPRVRQHAADDPVFREGDRRALSLRQVCAGGGRRFHFRRNGKHFGDHADRRHAARCARASRFFQRPAGRARAGASMVGRSADLPRLVACVAQRGLRDLLRGAVVRGKPAPTSSRGTCARIGGHLDEDSRYQYRRPIVTNRYRAPIELFDRHLYEKGSLVLHMLRRITATSCFSNRSISTARAIVATT